MDKSRQIIRQKSYEIFRNKCMKMVESKFLLAQPCISAVLKCIIASPELYSFFKELIINIDLDAELCKSTVDSPTGKFIIPESRRVMIALITYLLNQFDNNEIDLMDFISYYYNNDTSIGYQIFCQEVIVPYYNIVGELFLHGVTEEQIIQKEEEPNINSAVLEQAEDILKDLISSIKGENSLSETERDEMTILCEGMLNALNSLDRKIILAVWIGMKNIISRNRRLTRLIKDLERLLNKYLII